MGHPALSFSICLFPSEGAPGNYELSHQKPRPGGRDQTVTKHAYPTTCASRTTEYRHPFFGPWPCAHLTLARRCSPVAGRLGSGVAPPPHPPTPPQRHSSSDHWCRVHWPKNFQYVYTYVLLVFDLHHAPFPRLGFEVLEKHTPKALFQCFLPCVFSSAALHFVYCLAAETMQLYALSLKALQLRPCSFALSLKALQLRPSSSKLCSFRV